MDYKILESHILFNHPHNDFIVSVAIESAPGYWKAYHKTLDEISNKSLQEVAKTGSKLTKHRALEIFESCRVLEKQNRFVFEG